MVSLVEEQGQVAGEEMILLSKTVQLGPGGKPGTGEGAPVMYRIFLGCCLVCS